MKQTIATLLLLISISIISSAQKSSNEMMGLELDTKSEQWYKQFTFEPAYIFIHGLKLNYDIPMPKEGHYLIAQPMMFYNDNNSEYYNSSYYMNMRGFGLNVGHRIYLQPKKYTNGIYFQYNMISQRFKTNHDELQEADVVENDVTYTHFEQTEFSKHFTKTGFDLLFGKQYFMDDLVVLDLYLGVGFRYTFDDDFKQFTDFNNEWTDMGYSGLILNGGMRLGIMF